MDPRLLSWGRRVHRRTGLPALWLFTDEGRLADPRAAVARLPRGLAGVVLRHDAAPDRLTLGRDLARICRVRRLALVVAGDVRLAAVLRAGVHLRAGRWPGAVRLPRARRLLTSSAHTGAELRRARLAGAQLVFLSPAFPTASHPGAPGLGATRWSALARRAGGGLASPGPRGRGMTAAPGGVGGVAALGGVSSANIHRLAAKVCAGMGAISALTSGERPCVRQDTVFRKCHAKRG